MQHFGTPDPFWTWCSKCNLETWHLLKETHSAKGHRGYRPGTTTKEGWYKVCIHSPLWLLDPDQKQTWEAAAFTEPTRSISGSFYSSRFPHGIFKGTGVIPPLCPTPLNSSSSIFPRPPPTTCFPSHFP